MPPEVTVWVYMLRSKPYDNCNGDPISLHATMESAEAELKKFNPASWFVIEPWPVIP